MIFETLTVDEVCRRCKRTVPAGDEMAVYGLRSLALQLRRCRPCDREVNAEIARHEAKCERAIREFPDGATDEEIARINKARREGFGQSVSGISRTPVKYTDLPRDVRRRHEHQFGQ